MASNVRKYRIYCDTSVIGGCFDKEFAEDSLRFFDYLKKTKSPLLVSEIVIEELEQAPIQVKRFFQAFPTDLLEKVPITEEVVALRNRYISENIIGPKWVDDATHVAAATVARADAIVSWNFTHIVRLDRMKEYNRVNLINGFGLLTIITPKEIRDEKES